MKVIYKSLGCALETRDTGQEPSVEIRELPDEEKGELPF